MQSRRPRPEAAPDNCSPSGGLTTPRAGAKLSSLQWWEERPKSWHAAQATSALWERANRHLVRYGHSFQPVIIDQGRRAPFMTTTDGRRMLDFASGQMSTILGHSHPEITAVIREQAGELVHLYSQLLSRPGDRSRRGAGRASRRASSSACCCSRPAANRTRRRCAWPRRRPAATRCWRCRAPGTASRRARRRRPTTAAAHGHRPRRARLVRAAGADALPAGVHATATRYDWEARARLRLRAVRPPVDRQPGRADHRIRSCRRAASSCRRRATSRPPPSGRASAACW